MPSKVKTVEQLCQELFEKFFNEQQEVDVRVILEHFAKKFDICYELHRNGQQDTAITLKIAPVMEHSTFPIVFLANVWDKSDEQHCRSVQQTIATQLLTMLLLKQREEDMIAPVYMLVELHKGLLSEQMLENYLQLDSQLIQNSLIISQLGPSIQLMEQNIYPLQVGQKGLAKVKVSFRSKVDNPYLTNNTHTIEALQFIEKLRHFKWLDADTDAFNSLLQGIANVQKEAVMNMSNLSATTKEMLEWMTSNNVAITNIKGGSQYDNHLHVYIDCWVFPGTNKSTLLAVFVEQLGILENQLEIISFKEGRLFQLDAQYEKLQHYLQFDRSVSVWPFVSTESEEQATALQQRALNLGANVWQLDLKDDNFAVWGVDASRFIRKLILQNEVNINNEI